VSGSRWTRRRILAAGTLGAAGALIPGCLRSVSTPRPLPPPPRSTGFAAADAIVASTAPPAIPAATFPLHGARGDGRSDDTRALQDAIDLCHGRGGGHVVVPAGEFLVGALRLRSRVDVHLEADATLRFSDNREQYPLVQTRYEGFECVNRSPMIHASGEMDVAITGSGRLDASATAAWNRGADRAGVLEPLVARGVPPAHRIVAERLRTAMVETVGCARVLIQGITLVGSPFWQIHPTLCVDVTVEAVITTDSGPNSDGCDPESCERVVIRGCTFGCGDDNIALKSGRDEDGRRLAVPCRDVVVVGCQAEGRFGFITCGSEQSGGIENVYACANRSFGRGVGHALWVKSNSRRGGYTRNVNIDGFRGRVLDAVAAVTMHYDGQSGAFPPAFDGIHLRNLAVESAGAVLDLDGLEGSPIRNFTLSQSTFVDVGAPDRVRSANVVRRDVTVNGGRRD
jgi:polygalacturonase